MNADDAREFESEPYFDLAVRVRRYDDMGKLPDMVTPGLDSFIPLLQTFVRTAA
jgi:predicted HD phosphohydrolase